MIIVSTSAAARVGAAEQWLLRRGRADPLLLVAATADAANDLVRRVAQQTGSVFGWQRKSLTRLAGEIAAPRLATEGRVPLGAFGMQALVARVVHQLRADGALGRYESVADCPGLPVAMAQTIEELQLAGLPRVVEVDEDLARLLDAYRLALTDNGLVDRAGVLQMATEVISAGESALSIPRALLLLDLQLAHQAEAALVQVVAASAVDLLATVPAGDQRTLDALTRLLGEERAQLRSVDPDDEASKDSALGQLQQHLFEESKPPAGATEDDDRVIVFSAPGESRECVEIARRILLEADRGVPFDRMAVLLHAVGEYRSHIEEALCRARIPVYFARGAVAPDPAGRAFVSLLACATEGLSAVRFAEYLSLGEVPQARTDGTPPSALPSAERWVPPDEEVVSQSIVEAGISDALIERELLEQGADAGVLDVEQPQVIAGSLRAPQRWERLLNEAAVIGGRERWQRRLEGLSRQLQHSRDHVEDPDDPLVQRLDRDLADLAALRDFALPLLADLAALPKEASWGEWIEQLSALATRALRRPNRVLGLLAELKPMAPIGPVELTEVLVVLRRRLTEVTLPPRGRRYGAVYVGSTTTVRGLCFDVVFVPGLAEKLFPHKIIEDAILPDRGRQQLHGDSPGLLETDEDRVRSERLALRQAIGAASQRAYLSYPRLDLQHGRPRVPSFYGLEVVRAAEGHMPLFNELARRAEVAGAARIGWPAPQLADQAIDEAEHDLSLIEQLLTASDPSLPDPDMTAVAAQLLASSGHMARAVRFRRQRWSDSWTPSDGLVDPSSGSLRALARQQLSERSFSPTALQHYAACPYRFLLSAICRLAPREVPEAMDEMNPLVRGSMIHEVQFCLFEKLRDAGLLPVTPSNLEQAREALDEVIGRIASNYRDEFAPAIGRVWDDGIQAVRGDLREWLRRASIDRSGWVPWRFEFSFGLAPRPDDPQDPHSVLEPVQLDCGLQLRGKIDLVEREAASGTVRVTDHKTGKVWMKKDAVINGGQALQPLLYALAGEKLFGEKVTSGRLYYCTLRASFSERVVALDERAVEVAGIVGRTIGVALQQGFFPAAPEGRACMLCDYATICGPYESYRVQRKPAEPLQELCELRELP